MNESTFGFATFTYTKEQLDILAMLLSTEGRLEDALRHAMQDVRLWNDLPPHDRAYYILERLRIIEANGGAVYWPNNSEMIHTVTHP